MCSESPGLGTSNVYIHIPYYGDELTHLRQASHKSSPQIKGTLANSIDPDQMLQNAASDQGLHCLH